MTNTSCLPDGVYVYDSSFDDIPQVEELALASLVQVNSNMLKVKFLKVAMQTNGNDCDLYAIANALAFGRDPSTQVYIPRLMREHLIKCLENRHFEHFSITKGSKSRGRVIKTVLEVPVYCTCKRPDARTLYVICDLCSMEYHPECIGLDGQLTDSKVVHKTNIPQ